MVNFKLYKNISASRAVYPYLVDVQSSLLSDLSTRTVLPVILESAMTKPISILNPIISIEDKKYLVITQQIASIPKTSIGEEVLSVEIDRTIVLAAIDFLITGF